MKYEVVKYAYLYTEASMYGNITAMAIGLPLVHQYLCDLESSAANRLEQAIYIIYDFRRTACSGSLPLNAYANHERTNVTIQ